jgi:hypothetical protein
MEVRVIKPRAKPTGNMERDCPPDKINFKKAKSERFTLTTGDTVRLFCVSGSMPLPISAIRFVGLLVSCAVDNAL